MKKSVIYEQVKLCVHSSIGQITAVPVPLKDGFGYTGQLIGECRSIHSVKGEFFCTVESSIDLKGRYPVITGLMDGDVLKPQQLVAVLSWDDETLEPFI